MKSSSLTFLNKLLEIFRSLPKLTTFRNLPKLETFQNLPKQHRFIIIGISCFLLLLFIIPSSDKSSSTEDNNAGNNQVGKRIQVALPDEFVPAEAMATHDAFPQSTKPPVRAKTPKNSKEAIGQLPSLEEPVISQEVGSIATDNLEKKTKIQDSVAALANLNWQTITVKNGDSLALILKRLGFSAQTTYAVSTAQGEDSKLLRRLNVGDQLRIANNEAKQLTALEYPLSKTDTLFINLVGDSYQSHRESKEVEIREDISYGTITSSFWNAGISAGLNDTQIINFANIFGWDMDFGMDIRSGDSFSLTYEKKYIDGEYIGPGNILAAEIINQGEVFQAIRFSDGEYYSSDGRSMRKAFLRAPVNFKYISSSFKPKRFHPVQKKWKAHRGIDYAAKTGTPVVAAGNGKVTDSTYNKYNGNYVFIQHGNGIVTKYLHFSKRAVKKGQRVKQGQTIGYVGATGLASGPHLHYEFLLNGVHRNPRTVQLPDARPIDKEYKAEFETLATKRLQVLSGATSALSSTQDVN
ncbi:peptidoglycan DD-metalloendopeptidase family protein [Colwellia echini]|uniref:Peptidoglycan DD-metalloendopeptidase family protein n=1 Tax=Colwellia echini TaxID=1982103 RepID=A0ABY3N0I6_9GAMM|nr:peptidoglycan DD-metalloendopeptidase family protein [Colwellia echini]TYK67006.1 peptidoglycan DD-metalloendopeptidase family protein [Colwellia echini]